MPELVICSLGPLSIEYQGSALNVDTRKASALLIYLAIEAQPRSRDAIAALLWPDYDQTRARAALRRTLSVLHKALGGHYLTIERERVALDGPIPPWVDAPEFRRLLALRRVHPHAEKEVCPACLEPLKQAVALYRDDFLSGFTLRDSGIFEEWQLGHRQALRDELAIALAALTRCYILVGELTEAIAVGRRWLALDPLNEQASRFLMRLYDWTGQRAAALRQYRECAQTLERELGTPPLAVTTRLYEAIRTHRAPGPPEAVADPNSVVALQAEQSIERDAALPQPAQAPHPAGASAPLIGRDEEWAAARGAFEASAHAAHLLVIEGEAGIGKTRLADDLSAYARQRGAVVGVARCYQGESTLAYTAVVALLRSVVGAAPAARLHDLPDIWLSEAARLAPELTAVRPNIPAPAPLDTPGAQSRFFAGLRETLIAACATGTPPGLLLVDDAQWADEASLDALTYLARRLEWQPVCLLLTWRSDAVDSRHRLWRLLTETQRQGRATRISLRRLGEDDVRAWLRHDLGVAHEQHAPELAARLYQETEGLPFFIAQYVIALTSGAVSAAGETWVAPVGVHDLLQSRLSALSEMAWQALTAAATLGRSFDLDTVREVSGRSEEEMTAALDELLAHGLIREAPDTRQDEISYDFTHDKLRALVYDETSLARKRLLHRRAAEALVGASRRQRQGAERAAQIAQHYAAAGDNASAAEQHTIAGGRARELYAHADAIWHFQRALTLGYPDVAQLHEAIGDAYTLQGDYTEALASYSEAASHAHTEALARVLHRIGGVHGRRGEWEVAQRYFQAAVDALRAAPEAETPGAQGELARIHADWSLTARHLEAPEQARIHAERALELATAAADLHALAQAHNILGALANGQGEPEAALRHLEESLALAERLGDATTRAAALNNLALALRAMGQIDRALPLAEAALALSVTLGDRHHEAALHNNVADLLHESGHVEDAMAHIKQAVSIYAEIGVEAGAVQPGIWKMVDW
jgi:predicted ATPase/DNA-binding SARP family transcriptional activator